MKKTLPDYRRNVSVAFLLSTLFALVPPMGLGSAGVVLAQQGGVSIPCNPPPLGKPIQIPLANEQKEIGPWAEKAGIFFENIKMVDTIGDDAVVCLSASGSQLKDLRVDDQIQIIVRSEDKRRSEPWTYNFYDFSTKGIIPGLTPQDLSRLFRHGKNEVHIILRDEQPRYHSSTELWLWIWQGTQPTSTPTPLPTSTPTATPTPPFPILIASVSPTTVEQGRPFTLTAEIIPNVPLQRLTSEATIKAGGGGIVQEKIVLSKQEFADKPNLFAAKFAPIDKTGIYALTLHVEGVGNNGIIYGRDNRLDKIVELRVVEPSLPIAINFLSPTKVEQGHPFTVTVEIVPLVPLQRIASDAVIKAGGGGIVGEKTALVRQEYSIKPNVFAAGFAPISSPGTYYLTFHVEGTGYDGVVYGKNNELDKTVELEIVEPYYWSLVRTCLQGGMLLLILVLLLRYPLSPKPQGGFIPIETTFGRAGHHPLGTASTQYFDFKNRPIWRRFLKPSKVHAFEIGMGDFYYVVAKWQFGKILNWPFILQTQTYFVATEDGVMLGTKKLVPETMQNRGWLRRRMLRLVQHLGGTRFAQYFEQVKIQRRPIPYMPGSRSSARGNEPIQDPTQELLVENLQLAKGNCVYRYQSQPPDQTTKPTGNFRRFNPFGNR